jgi:hypothetical protein
MTFKNAYQLAMIHSKENMGPRCLNLEEGVAKTMMDKIVEHKLKE